MGMSVNPVGERVVNVAPKKVDKKPDYVSRGAKVGACVGLGVSATSSFIQRGLLKFMKDSLIAQGASKAMAHSTVIGAVALGAALSVGLWTLAGAGIGKIVDHFKKPKEQPEQPQKIY